MSTHSDLPTVLVTGAAGRHGGTGPHVVRLLRARGIPVRAMVRRLDERADRLRALGAEVVEGDFHSVASLRAAMDGVGRVYFNYPIDARLLEAATTTAVAARDAGVHALVHNSLMPARADHPSPEARGHWLAERVFAWAGVGAVQVRGAFFYENLVRWVGASVAADGEIRLPFGAGDGAAAWVAAEDVARVVAAILATPTPHLGQTYNVTGPDAPTFDEVATLFAQALERPVAYVDVPLARWQRDLAVVEGPNPHLIEHLSRLADGFRLRKGGGGMVTDVARRITGSDPQPLGMFINAWARASADAATQA